MGTLGGGAGVGATAVWVVGVWVVGAWAGAWSVSEADCWAAAMVTNVADAINTMMQFFRI